MSDKRSCADCPFSMSPDVATKHFKRPMMTPMCSMRQIPLATVKQTDEAVRNTQANIAGGCKFYIDGRSEDGALAMAKIKTAGDIPKPSFQGRDPIALGMPFVMAPDVERNAVMTCKMCEHHITETEIGVQLGMPGGLCSAKGKLVMSNELGDAARGCESRKLRRNTSTPVTVDEVRQLIFKEYDDTFGVVDMVEAIMSGEIDLDPTSHVSDYPVSDEDRAAGIVSWRKVVDPRNETRAVALPIYSLDSLPEAERELVPRVGDDEHPELYQDHFGGVYATAVAWTELEETPAAWGEAGTGKTELYRHMAFLMQLPFRRISITASTELDDIAGKMRFEPGDEGRGTWFQYGRLADAWSKPGVICLDEPNTGPKDVWQFIRPLTDNSKQLVMDMNAGEVIKRHPDSFLGMAMNPAWDSRNLGANELGDADTNRLFHIAVPLPDENVEREIIRRRVALDGYKIEEARLNEIIATAAQIREQIGEGNLNITWAIRPQIKVARALRWFSPTDAYKRAVGDFLDPDSLEAILVAVRGNFQSEKVNQRATNGNYPKF